VLRAPGAAIEGGESRCCDEHYAEIHARDDARRAEKSDQIVQCLVLPLRRELRLVGGAAGAAPCAPRTETTCDFRAEYGAVTGARRGETFAPGTRDYLTRKRRRRAPATRDAATY